MNIEFDVPHIASDCIFKTLEVSPSELVKNLGDMHDKMRQVVHKEYTRLPQKLHPIAEHTYMLMDQYAVHMNNFIRLLNLPTDKERWMQHLQSYIVEGRIDQLRDYASQYFLKPHPFTVVIEAPPLPIDMCEYKRVVEECFVDSDEVLPKTMQEKLNYIQKLKTLGPKVAAPDVLNGKQSFRQFLDSYGGDFIPYFYKGVVINVRLSEVDYLADCLEYCQMDLSELDNCVIDLDVLLKYYYAKSVLGKRV